MNKYKVLKFIYYEKYIYIMKNKSSNVCKERQRIHNANDDYIKNFTDKDSIKDREEWTQYIYYKLGQHFQNCSRKLCRESLKEWKDDDDLFIYVQDC